MTKFAPKRDAESRRQAMANFFPRRRQAFCNVKTVFKAGFVFCPLPATFSAGNRCTKEPRRLGNGPFSEKIYQQAMQFPTVDCAGSALNYFFIRINSKIITKNYIWQETTDEKTVLFWAKKDYPQNGI